MTLPHPVPAGVTIRQSEILDLEAHMLGDLIRPAHDDYDAARQVRNLSIDRHPAMIARAADAADVIRAVTFAPHHHLPLAVRSRRHSPAGHSNVEMELVLHLARIRRISRET